MSWARSQEEKRREVKEKEKEKGGEKGRDDGERKERRKRRGENKVERGLRALKTRRDSERKKKNLPSGHITLVERGDEVGRNKVQRKGWARSLDRSTIPPRLCTRN